MGASPTLPGQISDLPHDILVVREIDTGRATD